MSSAWRNAWNSSSSELAISTDNQIAMESNATCQISMTKWNRLSAAHRTVIKQISYLALVNYADLLLCGCSSHWSESTSTGAKTGGILDRGAVSTLGVLELFSSLDISKSGQQMEDEAVDGANDDGDVAHAKYHPAQKEGSNSHTSKCLWSNESTERTTRLALAAYCDASELDATDPTLWFKLACAARSLGWEIDTSSSPLASSQLRSCRPPRSYRSLERLALERGISSLPPGVPPNRLLMRAWREMENWDRNPSSVRDGARGTTDDADVMHSMDESALREDAKHPIELVLHLPRYSWTALGRILMRACQEGTAYGQSVPAGALHHVWSTNCNFSEDCDFGSPLVDIRISPLLAIPHGALGRVCEFLEESTDTKRLMCTCRTMSSELASAKAELAEDKKRTVFGAGGKDTGTVGNSTEKDTSKEGNGDGADSNNPDDCGTDTTAVSNVGGNNGKPHSSLPRRGRVSKRVRSQMITSEKQAERKSKRSSVEYCLLAGFLSCTAQNPYYTKLLKAEFDWERLPLVENCMEKLPALSQALTKSTNLNARTFYSTKNAQSSSLRNQSNEFFAPTSLHSFVGNWSRHNSGPRNFLELFLVHISLNAGDVFVTEIADSLSSCAIDCFDMMIASAERYMELTPWYGPETLKKDGNLELALQALAVNLLNAELRLKRCESHDIGSQDYQEDSDILAFTVSNLLQFVSSISQLEDGMKQNVLQLQCRCHWLASSYYKWIGRCSSDASTSKAAEELELEYLNKTMHFFEESPSNENRPPIRTMHLQSPDRRGDHWSALSAKSLAKYEDHLRSSSIVSRARQSFQEIQNRVQERHAEDNIHITADEREKLASLGAELLQRYNVSGEKSSDVMQELLEDFLLLHEDHLRANDATLAEPTWAGETHWSQIWSHIPSNAATMFNVSREGSRPSILQVLAFSTLASEENKKIPSVFFIFSKLALTAITSCFTLQKGSFVDDPQLDFEMDTPVSINQDGSIDAGKTGHARRQHLLMLAVNFFADKMTDIITSYSNKTEMLDALEAFLGREDLCGILFSILNVSPSCQKDLSDDSILQFNLFQSASRLVLALRQCQGLTVQGREKVEGVYFAMLTKALIQQKSDFADLISSTNDKRLKKWQSDVTSKADLIFTTSSEIAELLSLNPSTVNSDGEIKVSHLIKAIAGDQSHSTQPSALSPLARLTEALLFWWKFLNDKFDASSPTEKSIRNRLMVPISSAIIAVCSSSGVSIEGAFIKAYVKPDSITLSFSDYFDSEDSANGLFLPDGSTEEDEKSCQRRILLRKFCQLVQCVSLVFRAVDENLICQEYNSPPFPSSQHGPFLPLVVIRVLSSLSDGIFDLFSENVWSETYPYGARECGAMIDSLLGRAYSYIFGFSFSGVDSDTSIENAPESVKMATQIFRCIKRVYGCDNRKSPPNRAFETVELALPPAEESKASQAIKAFLFNAEKNIEVTTSNSDIPPGFPEFVLSDAGDVGFSGDERQADINMLRRGICRELAKGPITNLDSSRKSPSDMDDQGLSEERELSTSHELSLDRKFCAVLGDLCYNPNNIKGWIVLSESLGFKADNICDRLVPIQESYESSEFCLTSESKSQIPLALSSDQLQTSQLDQFQKSKKDWVPFIGNDLYVYMQYPWSSLSSLQACAKDIGSNISKTDADSDEGSSANEHNIDYLSWKEVESKIGEGKHVMWANAWAGMFVTALRTMRMKALLVARYLAKKSQGGMHPSEVSEDLGTALYGDLMASTVYGSKIHPMTQHEKRKIAESSIFYFQEAVKLSASNDYTPKSQTVVWEVQFMIGKCYEKIASTMREEKYASSGSRMYEAVMVDAISNYFKAYTEAKKAELTNGSSDTTKGGSSHGALECLYRLHASRFKILLYAVKRAKEECDLAEQEAFRVTSTAWFDESNQSATTGVRGKTWDIFSDCVDALSHCRREVPLFHRAAYRLAQAYNYAPCFHNPDCDLRLGSKQAVPAIKSYRIRGLDTDSCAESAGFTISKLFDKRRAQLCAVWVTTSTAPPPFEVLNDSIRKYDALRLKYVRAFIDSMCVSEQKDKIESLFNWALSGNQDLPSFYEASGELRGGDPGRHSKQPLLRGSGKGFITMVKRNAINAIAEMILKDLAVMKKSGVNNEMKLKLTQYFKLAHSLYLRLNSSCKEVAEFTKSNKLAVVEAFCKCYLSIQAGYRISSIHFGDMDGETLCSILEGAISKAKTMIQEAKSIMKK